MIRKIVKTKDTRLRQVSKPVKAVDKKILKLVNDLKETLIAQKDPEGVGLAAPQIGKNLRVFVMKTGSDIKEVINPEILEISKKEEKEEEEKDKIMEGCLSLPHYYGPLKRAKKVKLKYKTASGEEKEEEFIGFEAQLVQHEMDHLDGILFIDRLLEQKKSLYKQKADEWVEVDI